MGTGKLLGFERTCEVCGGVFGADGAEYQTAVMQSDLDIQTLITQSHSQLTIKYADRMELEQRLRARRLTSEQRAVLLREPFFVLNPLIESRSAAAHFDPYSAASLLVTLGIVIAMATGVEALLSRELRTTGFGVIGATAILGMLVTVIFLATDVRRFAKKRVYPLLATALAPLQPSREELQSVLAQCKTLGLAVGKKIRADQLFDTISIAGTTFPVGAV